MPTKETTYAGMLGDWQRLLAYLAAHSAELPHLDVSRGKLDGLLNQVEAVTKRQALLNAGKQEASRQLKTLMTDGQRLATLLRSSLKEHYGVRSEKLLEFGLQPFRGRKTKPTEPELPELPETPASSR